MKFHISFPHIDEIYPTWDCGVLAPSDNSRNNGIAQGHSANCRWSRCRIKFVDAVRLRHITRRRDIHC